LKHCRVCAQALAPWGAAYDIPLLKCAGCGSIHADCGKPEEDLYANTYAQDVAIPRAVEDSLRAVVDSMDPYRTSGKWLDIGFGQGALLDVVAKRGWRAYGTEYSDVALRRGAERGFIVSKGSEALDAGSFDVVSLVELVEHVEEPLGFLKEARRLLRPGGCVYITTPNGWSINRWVLGDGWTNFGPPDHLIIFTPPAMRRLLTDAGFETADIRTEGLNPFEIVGMLKRRKTKQAIDRVNAGQRLCESLSASPGRRRIKATANIILRATRLGDSMKVRAH
jgi:SAM-dependent methyltransferase